MKIRFHSPSHLVFLVAIPFLLGGCQLSRLQSRNTLPPLARAVEFDKFGNEIRRAEIPLGPTSTLSWVSDLNDAARYMAGLPGGINSGIGPARDSPRWKLHQANVNELWRQFSSYRQPRIDAFAQRELSSLRNNGTVFYPFSGPDILFATAFFPHAQNYILCGLEGADPLPNIGQLTAEERETGLDGLYTAITTALNCSFFITKDMRVDLQRTKFKGTLPIMLVFLARLGIEVDSVTSIDLDPNGQIRETSGQGKGYQIRCKGHFGGGKNIYYFQQNLANDSLSPTSSFLKFVANFGASSTYLKSASYLMHSEGFSTIRSSILNSSRAVLQDDSGIPFRSFKNPPWDLRLYGTYTGVLDLFKENFQPDLLSAYEKQTLSVENINFGVGYKFNAGQSNLLLAVRHP